MVNKICVYLQSVFPSFLPVIVCKKNISSLFYVDINIFFFLAVELNEDLFELQQLLFSQLKPYTELKPMNHYHISLSKTVAIRHHWIQPLTDGLSKAFQEFSR